MNQQKKPFNLSLLVLTLLFILSQTAFALSATLSRSTSDNKALNTDILAQLAEAKPINYDIDITGKRLFMNGETNYEAGTSQLSDQVQGDQEILATAQIETMSTLSVPASAEIAPSEPPVTQAPKPNPVVKYVNANSLNVRKEANSNSDLVATVKRGDKVTYFETQGEWARIITWSDKPGYVLAKYLVASEKDVQKVVEPKKTASVSRGTTEKTTAPAQSAEAKSLAEKIVEYAKTLQGVKYVYGGYSTKGFDCSGFTKYVFAKFGISVPRSSGDYVNLSNKVARSDLKIGDIVMFDIDGGKADVGHVGIYIGGGKFIHASSSKGKVMIRDLATYGEKYMGARRVIK